jgi:hypothetical protein
MTQPQQSVPRAFPPQADKVVWDRRRSTRHLAREHRLWLGWRRRGDFFVIAAELVNISQGGALLLVDQPPDIRETVWLRLEGPSPIEDACALVIESARVGACEHSVRISFREPFPIAFYHAAIEGLEAIGGTRNRINTLEFDESESQRECVPARAARDLAV